MYLIFELRYLQGYIGLNHIAVALAFGYMYVILLSFTKRAFVFFFVLIFRDTLRIQNKSRYQWH